MNTAGVLDDYLEALLGDALPPPAPVTPAAPPAEAVASEAAGEREPTWDDLPAEVIYETGDATAVAAADDDALQAAFDAVAAPAAVTEAASEREPSWDDLPPEVVFETAPAPVVAAERAPTWDDLPDEVIYETSADEGAALANADTPALEAAFHAAAAGDAPAAPAPAAAPPPPPAPRAPAPMARPMPAAAPAAPPSARPSTWQELQAQAQHPASSPRQNRRAGERASRWLRLRCGVQAYALELLKVQEVVLPVPLLPLRGTSPAMLGIMNLRGQVVPVMDLGVHLGSGPVDEDSQTRIVVLEEQGEIIGLRVSAVEDVANLTDSQIEPPDTARICQISNDLFRGVARMGSRPMILLDATRLLN